MELAFTIVGLILSLLGTYYAYKQFDIAKLQETSPVVLICKRAILSQDNIAVGDIVEINLCLQNKSDIQFKARIDENLPENTNLVNGNITWSGKIKPNQSITLEYKLAINKAGIIYFKNPTVTAISKVLKGIEIVSEHPLTIQAEPKLPADIHLVTRITSSRLIIGCPFQIILQWRNTGSERAKNITYILSYPESILSFVRDESSLKTHFDLERFASEEHTLTLTALEIGDYTIILQDIQFEDMFSQVHSLLPCRIHLHIEFDWHFSPIGRDRELDILLKHIDNAKNYRGNLIVVHGEAGIGKSYLLESVIKRAEQQGFLCFKSSCEAFNETWAFYPFKRIFDDYLSLIDSDIVQARTTKAQIKFSSLGSDVLPYISILTRFLIGEDTSDKSTLIASPRELRGQFLFAIQKVFEAIAKKQPLIIYIDDLHLADSGTVDIIQHLSSRISNLPLLIIVTIRTEVVSRIGVGQSSSLQKLLQEMKIHKYCEDIFLGPLDQQSCHALLASFFPISEFPLDFEDLLFKETEGNPFYFREVIRSLIERGIIIKKQPNGMWVLSRKLNDLDIPDKVEQLIKMRLDFLKEEEIRELEKASVIGREFAYKLLKELSERDEETLIKYLGEYIDYRIIEELNESDETYQFSHGKIQEVVYQEIQSIRKRRLHSRVAEILEHVYAENLTEFSPIIAHHFYYGGNDDKALKYLTIAGIENAQVYANKEAVKNFEFAIELINKKKITPLTLQTLQDLKYRLASVYREINNFNMAEQLYSEALAIAEQLNDQRNIVLFLSRKAEAFAIWGEYSKAEDMYQKCTILVQNLNDKDLQLQLFNDLADLYLWQYRQAISQSKPKEQSNNYRELILTNATQALNLAQQLNDQNAIVRSYKNLGNYYSLGVNYFEALPYYEDAVKIAETHNLMPSKYAYIYVAKLYRLLGRFEDSIDAYDKYLTWAIQIGAQWAQLKGYQVLGLIAFEKGEYDKALNLLEQSMALNIIVKSKHEDMETLIIKGQILEKLGQFQEGIECYHEAMKLRGIQDTELESNALLFKRVGMEMYAREELTQAKNFLIRYRDLSPDISTDEQQELNDILIKC